MKRQGFTTAATLLFLLAVEIIFLFKPAADIEKSAAGCIHIDKEKTVIIDSLPAGFSEMTPDLNEPLLYYLDWRENDTVYLVKYDPREKKNIIRKDISREIRRFMKLSGKNKKWFLLNPDANISATLLSSPGNTGLFLHINSVGKGGIQDLSRLVEFDRDLKVIKRKSFRHHPDNFPIEYLAPEAASYAKDSGRYSFDFYKIPGLSSVKDTLYDIRREDLYTDDGSGQKKFHNVSYLDQGTNRWYALQLNEKTKLHKLLYKDSVIASLDFDAETLTGMLVFNDRIFIPCKPDSVTGFATITVIDARKNKTQCYRMPVKQKIYRIFPYSKGVIVFLGAASHDVKEIMYIKL